MNYLPPVRALIKGKKCLWFADRPNFFFQPKTFAWSQTLCFIINSLFRVILHSATTTTKSSLIPTTPFLKPKTSLMQGCVNSSHTFENHLQAHPNLCKLIPTHAHTRTCTHILTPTHTHTYTELHHSIHTHTHTHTQSNIHTHSLASLSHTHR